MYEILNSPIEIGNVRLKNRLVFAPTTMGLREEEYLCKLAEIAEGGAALIIIGDVPVLGKGYHSLRRKKGMDYYKGITNCIHSRGALAAAQLYVSDARLSSMIKYVPGMLAGKITEDDLRRKMNESISGYITGMDIQDVRTITDSFGEGAVLAVEAGFDIIQVHGDRMCGSFSSDLYNLRQDCYGVTSENRARFACDAVRAVKRAAPDIPIDFKLVVRQENPHYGNAGVLREELGTFIPLLEEAGADSFHITLADHSKLSDSIPPVGHPYFNQEGCFLPFCEEAGKFTNLPLCGVGKLASPGFIEEKLKEGTIQLAAMSRQLIADPDWLKKVNSGAEDEIVSCNRCNVGCLLGLQQHKGVHCVRRAADKDK
ncbi:bilirubin reductase [Anaerolentibacter hominis]|uniref:bilirubin reductase n=1 Tax=Anaerolentibacter hominis TaxID=3079009 RepID=UPI0031B84D92